MRQILAVAVLLLSVSTASAQSKRPAAFDDVLNIKAVQAATVSPDGRQVIYTVRQWVSEQDKMEARAHVWKVATDGSAPARQISFGEKGDSQPQFSPDGKFISFVSARGSAEAKSQIYLMPIDGGEAWKLTDAKENVSSYSWAPDSAKIGTRQRSAQRRGRANIRNAMTSVCQGDSVLRTCGGRTSHQAGGRHHGRHAYTVQARRRGRPPASACVRPGVTRCCATTARHLRLNACPGQRANRATC